MRLIILPSKQFKRQYRRLQVSGNVRLIHKLDAMIEALACGEKLPESARSHKLLGNLNKYVECHVEPDWLLIYQVYEENLILELFATGTHATLFG